MASLKLDDPAVLAAMRSYLAAVDALDSATDEKELLQLSEVKAMAGLQLRKQLSRAGQGSREDSTR